jgi:hypothetical protein
MIRDGRMPAPEQAVDRVRYYGLSPEEIAERQARRERRAQRPSEQRRRARQEEYSRLLDARWQTRLAEKVQLPLYEVLDQVFDFRDPDLWKSNSFASLRPRLNVHVKAAVAKLEAETCEASKWHRGRRMPDGPYLPTGSKNDCVAPVRSFGCLIQIEGPRRPLPPPSS